MKRIAKKAKQWTSVVLTFIFLLVSYNVPLSYAIDAVFEEISSIKLQESEGITPEEYTKKYLSGGTDVFPAKYETIPQRSREEILSQVEATYSEEGAELRAAKFDKDSLVSDEELSSLFDLSRDEVIRFSSPVDVEEEIARGLGVNIDTIKKSVRLHGDVNELILALNSYNIYVENELISSEMASDILTLILHGYKTSQAFSIYTASKMLNASIEEVSEYKAQELERESDTPTPYSDFEGRATHYSDEQKILHEDKDDSFLGRMGMPAEIIKKYSYGDSDEELAAKYEQALEDVASSFKNDPSLQPENGGKQLQAGDGLYTPEKILEQAYLYDSQDYLDINLNTGAYRYHETDLHIPGVNGLDLEITRWYDSDAAEVTTPGGINYFTNYYPAFTVRYEWYNYSYGTPIFDKYRYHILDPGTSQQAQMIYQFSGNQFAMALDYKDYVLGTIMTIAYDEYGQSIIVLLKGILDVVSPYFELSVGNRSSLYTYSVNEFGLGQGWRLGFSAIERYTTGMDQYSTDKKRLIMSDGRRYEIIEESDGSLRLAGYALGDMSLYRYGNGSTFYLLHKDGKTEYFDQNGRVISIQDRFGNAITFRYLYTDAYSQVVNTIIITDTLGNEIRYAIKESLVWGALENPGESATTTTYNAISSLYFNNQLVRTYYTYDEVDTRYLRGVSNENNETTIYVSKILPMDYNSFTTYPYANSTTFYAVCLSDIVYPGHSLNLVVPGIRTRLGRNGNQIAFQLAGYRITYIDEETGNRRMETDTHYSYGDFNYWSVPIDYINYSTIKSTFQVFYLPDVGREFSIKVKTTNYCFNNNHIQITQENRQHDAIRPNSIKNYQDYINTLSIQPTIMPMKQFTHYSYATNILYQKLPSSVFPSTINAYTFGFNGDASPAFLKTWAYAYDDQGNVLMEQTPDGVQKSYMYSQPYSIRTRTHYLKNYSTEVIELNELTPDRKSIYRSLVQEAGNIKSDKIFGYNTRGQIIAESSKQGTANYIERFYEYALLFPSARPSKVITRGVRDADGVLVSGTPGYSEGTVVEETTYNDRGWVVGSIDAKLNATSIEYDPVGRVIWVANPDGSTETYEYQIRDHNILWKDANGTTLQYKYDLFGHLLEIYDLAYNRPLAQYEYDDFGNRIYSTLLSDHLQPYTQYTFYDYSNRPIEVGYVGDNEEHITVETNQYYDDGNRVHTVGYENANVPIAFTDTFYDVMDRPFRIARFNEDRFYLDEYWYDNLGNIVEIRDPYANSISAPYTMRYTYDYAGNVLSAINALGQAEYMAYDAQGNLTSHTDRKGATTLYSYDVLNRLVRKQTPFESNQFGTQYTENKYYYDANGNMVSEQLSNNKPNVGMSYAQTDYAYDNRNRLHMVTMYDNGMPENYTQYYYDAVGNILRMYTGLSSPLSITGLDRVSGADSSYSITKYAYNHLGHAVSMTDPLGQMESYVYDRNGSIASKTDRNANHTAYTYDEFGRLAHVQVSTAGGQGDTYIQYTYNLNGSKQAESNPNGTTIYKYDNLGRVVSETSGSTKLSYTYNAGNARTSLSILMDGVYQLTASYAYDVLNRLTNVSGGGFSTSYGYDANGNRAYLQYGNGVRADYAYNLANLPVSLSNTRSGSLLSGYSYAYTLDGNQISETESNGRSTTYTYDGLGRLVREESGGSGQSNQTYAYTFDDYGNRVMLTASGPESYSTSYMYDKNNRLLQTNKQAGASSEFTLYQHDPNGNQLSSSVQQNGVKAAPVVDPLANTFADLPAYVAPVFGVTEDPYIDPVIGMAADSFAPDFLDITPLAVAVNSTNRYNGFNQLVESVNGSTVSTYTYNAAGLRISKTVNGTATSFVLDGGNVALELKNGMVSAQYVYGIDLIGANVSGTQSYYSYNAYGDVTARTNMSGNVIQAYDYDAFGVERGADPSDANPFRYSGEYYDRETGTYYLRARNYNPTTGRFLAEDTSRGDLTNSLSLNLYTYCWNNPILYADSTGNWPEFKDVTRTVARWIIANPAVVNATQQGWYSDQFYALGFFRENEIYHARVDAWQQVGGFNDFYDVVFDHATSMERAKFQFTSGDREYIFWAWKGNYLNLGAGAELGIYSNKSGILGQVDITSPLDSHWLVDTSLAMTMSMTLHDREGNQIFSYSPNEKQWWITGFNPYRQGVKADELIARYTITFNNQTMYNDFYKTWGGDPRWTVWYPKAFTATLEF